MDKNEDIKTPSALLATAGEPANPAANPPTLWAQAGAPAGESRIGLASIESPTIAPRMTDMAAEASGLDAPRIERPVERPAAAEKCDETQSESPHQTASVSRDIVLLAAPAPGRASRTFSEFTLFAASVVLASAFGAMAGVFGATGMMVRLAGEAATAEASSSLLTTIAELRSEVADLKSGVDATSRATSGQYSKLVERFDRVERLQSGANKSDAALPKEASREASKETTGSITAPSAAAAPLVPAPVPSSANAPGTVLPGWAVRDVYRGVAMLQSRVGGMVEVEPGDVLPGLGRIESIRRQDGRWVVFTSKGMITSMR